MYCCLSYTGKKEDRKVDAEMHSRAGTFCHSITSNPEIFESVEHGLYYGKLGWHGSKGGIENGTAQASNNFQQTPMQQRTQPYHMDHSTSTSK